MPRHEILVEEPRPVEEREAKKILEKTLETIVDSSIGEGESGIIVTLDDPRLNDWVIKYHKLGYSPNEFMMLKRLFDAGAQVPKPWFESPLHSSFIMERVYGKDLDVLLKEGLRFAPDVVEELEEIAQDFNTRFTHNDFHPRNVMLDKISIRDGIVLAGNPVIIDVERVKTGKSTEWQRVRGWFRGKLGQLH